MQQLQGRGNLHQKIQKFKIPFSPWGNLEEEEKFSNYTSQINFLMIKCNMPQI